MTDRGEVDVTWPHRCDVSFMQRKEDERWKDMGSGKGRKRAKGRALQRNLGEMNVERRRDTSRSSCGMGKWGNRDVGEMKERERRATKHDDA